MKESTKKTIRNIAWIVTAIGIVTLFVLGVTKEEITAGTVLLDVAVLAAAEAVRFIIGKLK